MSGSVVDLSAPDIPLPASMVCDSSVVIDWLGATSLAVVAAPPPTPVQFRAAHLIARLQRERTVGAVTSTSLAEIFHFVLKTAYRREVVNQGPALLARFPNVRRHGWQHLFKARSDLMPRFAGAIDQVRRPMRVNNLALLQPVDLGDIPSGRTLDDELVRTMERHELDSNDAAILVEARRDGITAVASSDADFRRAHPDFDVFTWL